MTPATFELFFSVSIAVESACKKESRRDPPGFALAGFALQQPRNIDRDPPRLISLR
jgi:hypothetical protein